jgi:carboxylesterase type B
LAEQGDIIVVTVNYRLGALGFFNGGNYALPPSLPTCGRMAARMIAHWAAFVRNGTPDVDGVPAWPSLQQQLSFRACRQGGNVELPLEEYQAQHRCGLWRQLPVIMDRGGPRP